VAKTRKTEKTVEIHEFYVIRTASGSLPPLCGECTTEDGIMIAPEQAAMIASVPVRTIYQWVESETVHYRQTSNGSIIVCVRSLPITTDQVTRALE
jgi:hypothetical protein